LYINACAVLCVRAGIFDIMAASNKMKKI